ncbi:RNA polymerase sigma factor [Muribaculum intestinale]|nr:sigma-70 family RNA polymerase sigma factor [Muribaculum intestinale]
MRQETYVNLWRGMDRFRGESDVRTWVYRVALNSCVSFFRRNRRADAHIPLSALTDVADEGCNRNELISEMHRLINRLDHVEKAMILFWLDGYPYDAIADVMAMPRNTVASRLK